MNNLPLAFEERMKLILKEEATDFFNALHTEPPVSIRFNPQKQQQTNNQYLAPVIDKAVPWCPEAFYLKERPVFTLDPCFHGGAYYVQEASSMFLHHIVQQLNLKGELRVLDLCAAPGGKSTLLASILPKDSLLVSNEVIRSRAAILKENIIRWGHHNIVVTSSDPSDFTALKGTFDLILVDAPCSGEGMFRKDPQAISEWSENNLQLCSERQKRIIADIWDTLKPDGYFIYSTCTYNREENEGIMEWINNTYQIEPVAIKHEYTGITPADSTIPGYHFYPHQTTGEGLFVSVLQKKDGEINAPKKNKKQNKIKPIVPPIELKAYLKEVTAFSFYSKEEITGMIPAIHEDFINLLESRLRVIYKGCELAEINNRKLKPLHSLALYSDMQTANCTLYEADYETALKYLKKEDIPVMAKAGEWVLIRHEQVALGWGKSLGNRLNNYFPKEWRIRMDISSAVQKS